MKILNMSSVLSLVVTVVLVMTGEGYYETNRQISSEIEVAEVEENCVPESSWGKNPSPPTKAEVCRCHPQLCGDAEPSSAPIKLEQ